MLIPVVLAITSIEGVPFLNFVIKSLLVVFTFAASQVMERVGV